MGNCLNKQSIKVLENACKDEKIKEISMNDFYDKSNIDKTSSQMNFLSVKDFIKGKSISKGIFGEVYNGLSSIDGGLVAIKIISLKNIFSNLNKEEGLLKLSNLGKILYILKDFNHKNLIKFIFTDDSLDNISYELTLIYEFCNGASIKKLLEKYGKFEEKTVKIYIYQIIEFFVLIHENLYEHRRIKSSNVLIDGNGTVRISDFLIDGYLLGENCKEIISNLNNNEIIDYLYIAPELINGKIEEIGKCDVWSLGILILEMLLKENFIYNFNINSYINTTKNNESNLSFLSSLLIETESLSNINISESALSFISICLTIDSTKRPSAKDLKNHPFFSKEEKKEKNEKDKQNENESIQNTKNHDYNEKLGKDDNELNISINQDNSVKLNIIQSENNNENNLDCSYIEDDYDIYELNSDIENSYQLIYKEKSLSNIDNSNIIIIGKNSKFNNINFNENIKEKKENIEEKVLGNITPINMTLINNPMNKTSTNIIDNILNQNHTQTHIADSILHDTFNNQNEINEITAISNIDEFREILTNRNKKNKKIMLIKKKDKQNKQLDIEYIRKKIQNNKLYLKKSNEKNIDSKNVSMINE